jgi:hypothetical protein
LASNVAWLNATLVQLDNFWTSNTLIWDTWQHFKQGLFCVYIRKQLSYIVLIWKKVEKYIPKFFFKEFFSKNTFRTIDSWAKKGRLEI